MVKRMFCLYNNEYIGIENFYKVIDNKKINVDNGMLEKIRKLGKRKELYCACGCGGNVAIVAGEKQKKAQHFRMITAPKYKCTAENENIISVYSKMMLNCWLKDALKISADEISSKVMLKNIVNNDRRYELTSFVSKYRLGLVYTRTYSNIDSEKINTLFDLTEDIKTLYICGIEKENDINALIGQYPEFSNKVQNRQGFCIFLELNDIKGENIYEKSKFVIKYNVKNHYGIWEKLEIAKGNLSEFSIDENNELLFRKTKVISLVENKKNEFNKMESIKIKEEYLESIREQEEERKRLKQIEEIKARERRERLKALEISRIKKKQQEDDEKKQIEEYDLKHKKSWLLYEYISNFDTIEGEFLSRQSNGIDKKYHRKVGISTIKFERKNNRIVIYDSMKERYLIYLKENGKTPKGCLIGTFYVILDLDCVEETELMNFLKQYFLCFSNKC